MIITREETLPTEVTLRIELETADVEPYLDGAYRRLVNTVRIQGFRKGKAPRSVLERVVGKEHLLHEALEGLVAGTVDKAVKEESLEPYIHPDVDVISLDPLSIKLIVALEPIITLGDYQELRVEREIVDVGTQQVDQVLERLRNDSAPWAPTDRPIRFNDQVTMNVVGTVGGQKIVEDEGIEYIPSMDNKLPLPGFSVLIEGAKKGESKSFTLPIPDDQPDSALAGKECRFEVDILETKEKILPEVDDEFAKGIGDGFEDLESLRNSVLENLMETAKREADQNLYDKVVQKVIEGSTIEFADILIDRELDHVWRERSQALRSQRLDMDTYLHQVGKSEEEIKEEMKPGIRDRMIRSLTLKKVAEDQQIEVTTEEIDTAIDGMLAASNSANESVRQAVATEDFRNSIESTILTRKTLERLAEITQGDDAKAKEEVEQAPARRTRSRRKSE